MIPVNYLLTKSTLNALWNKPTRHSSGIVNNDWFYSFNTDNVDGVNDKNESCFIRETDA